MITPISEQFLNPHILNLDLSHTVGDKIVDLQAATNAGTQGAFVKTGKPFTEEVRAYATKHGMGMFDDFAAFVNQLNAQ